MAAREEIYRGGGQVSRATPIPMASDDAFAATAIGRGMAQLGGELHQAKVRSIAIERQREEEAETARAGAELATMAGEMQVRVNELREGAQPGGEGHVEAVRSALRERGEALLGSIKSERVRERFAPRIAEITAGTVADEDGWARGRRLEDFKNNVGRAGDTWANTLQTNPDPKLLEHALEERKTTITGFGYGEAITRPLLEEEQSKLAEAYLNGLAEKDPVAAAAVVTSGVLNDYLTPRQLKTLKDGIDTEVRIAAADARRQQAQDEAQLRTDISEMLQRINDRGELPDDKDVDALISRATALGLTERIDDLRYARGKLKLSRETDKWTPREWAEQVDPLAAKVAKGTATAEEQMTLKILQELRGPKETRFRDRPREAAAAAGMSVAQVDIANYNGADVAATARWAESFAATSRLAEPPYLNRDQLRAYRDRAAQGPVAQLEVAAELKQWWGPKRAASIIRQMGGEDSAEMQLMLGLHSRMGQAYRRGIEALGKKLVTLDDGAARQVWQRYAPAVPEDLRPAMFSIARGIAAGWAAEQGRAELPEEQAAEIFGQALHRAAGMLGSTHGGNATGGFANWNGRFVWLPQDMSRRDFATRIARADPQAWVRAASDARGNPTGAVPHYRGSDGKPKPYTRGAAAQFKGFTFGATGIPGVYRLLGRDGRPAVDARGGPWQFDIRRLK